MCKIHDTSAYIVIQSLQLADKTTSLTDLEHKLQVAQGKSKELSQHIFKLNGYFENMPTMEEYLALKEHVSC